MSGGGGVGLRRRVIDRAACAQMSSLSPSHPHGHGLVQSGSKGRRAHIGKALASRTASHGVTAYSAAECPTASMLPVRRRRLGARLVGGAAAQRGQCFTHPDAQCASPQWATASHEEQTRNGSTLTSPAVGGQAAGATTGWNQPSAACRTTHSTEQLRVRHAGLQRAPRPQHDGHHGARRVRHKSGATVCLGTSKFLNVVGIKPDLYG